MNLLFQKLARLQQVHEATTPEALRAVFRQRYDVYVREFKRPSVHADHASRTLREPADDDDNAHLFTVGPATAPRASLRVRVWGPGQIPADKHDEYSLARFGDLSERSVCEVNYLIASDTTRGGLGIVALTAGVVEFCIERYGVDLLFVTCAPGLVSAYRGFGLRPYGADLARSELGGTLVPLVGVVADEQFLRSVQSPWLPAVKRGIASGQVTTTGLEALLAPLRGPSGLELDDEHIMGAMRRHVLTDRETDGFLARLAPRTLDRLAAQGFIIDLVEGDVLIRSEMREREMYVILEGRVQVSQSGEVLVERGPGEVVGELAYFRDSGARSADIQTLAPTRVLVIRKRFVASLVADHPAEAATFLEAMAWLLAEKLAQTTVHSTDTPTPQPEGTDP